VKTFTKITIVIAAIFLFLQVAVQLIIGVNPYIRWDWWEQFTHPIGGMVVTAILLIILVLPQRLDKWRIWIPLLSISSTMILGFLYEWVELIITWFHFMPVTAMYATPFNSFIIDLWHNFLGTLAIAFVWEECQWFSDAYEA
jgi:hypothetical protein